MGLHMESLGPFPFSLYTPIGYENSVQLTHLLVLCKRWAAGLEEGSHFVSLWQPVAECEELL